MPFFSEICPWIISETSISEPDLLPRSKTNKASRALTENQRSADAELALVPFFSRVPSTGRTMTTRITASVGAAVMPVSRWFVLFVPVV